MSELFFNNRYDELLTSQDEVEGEAVKVLSSLVSQYEQAKLLGTSGTTALELGVLIPEVEALLVKYKILKETAISFYAQYELEKQGFLKNLAASGDPLGLLSDAEFLEMCRIGDIKLLAHRYSLAQLAPAAVIKSIMKGKEFTPESAEHAGRDLSSYRMVDVLDTKRAFKAVATTQRVDDHLLETLRSNQELNTVVVNAPPGSGKTTFLNNLEVLLRLEGWEVVQISFDKVIAEFFALLQKETKEWSSIIADMFDSTLFNLEQIVKEYYPSAFKSKRVVVLTDIPGYRIDKMNYGLGMIRTSLRPLIEEDKALVLTIVSQPKVVEKAKQLREQGTIDAKNSVKARETLKNSQGAPAGAVVRHHSELDKRILEIQPDKDFKKIQSNIDLSVYEDSINDTELEQMKMRMAYAILIRDIFRISKNWWFALNLFKESGQVFEVPAKD